MKLKEKRDETSKTETQPQAEAASESRTPSHEKLSVAPMRSTLNATAVLARTR